MKNKLFFLTIVIIMSFMDVINFREFDFFLLQITNSGYDVWHLLKLILYGLIVYILFDKNKLNNYGNLSVELTIYICLAVFPHWFILHYIF